MNNNLFSDISDWLDISYQWYNGLKNSGGTIEELIYNAQDALDAAKDIVASHSEIGTISSNVLLSDIDNLLENKRKMTYFCNGIHYEIEEKIDMPFADSMGELSTNLIELDPNEIKYKPSVFTKYSVGDFLKCDKIDDELKNSFNSKMNSLNMDKIENTLSDKLKETSYWIEQFKIAEECNLASAKIFTDDVRSNWANYSVDERKDYLDRYRKELSHIFGGFWGTTKEELSYLPSSDGYGASYSSMYIQINEQFVTNPTGMYSLDKAIDTTTHEMRHQYQEKAKKSKNTPNIVKSDYNLPYIKNTTDYIGYYKQPVEEEAKAFAAISQDNPTNEN